MTLKEAEDLIDEIESIDLKTNSGLDKFNNIIEDKVIKSYLFKLTITPHESLFYVRARIHKKIDDYFKTIDDHSYNKKNADYIKKGRANFEKQAVFYVARDRITSLAEVNIIQNKKEEEKVAYGLSRWLVKKPMDIIAILNPDTMDKLNWGELEKFKKFLISEYKSLKGRNKEGTIRFYKYLSEKFTQRIVEGEEHKYTLTSTFTNQIFKKLPQIAGILYQSVKLPETYNLAIKPEFIDNQFMMPEGFGKQIFTRKNIVDLEEISLEMSISFDTDKNVVKWK